jgi:hypothetical protein
MAKSDGMKTLVQSSVKPVKGTGHVKGSMTGNMMGASNFHPKGGNLSEISIEGQRKAGAQNPGAKAREGSDLSKLGSSVPVKPGAWTGASVKEAD